jgi:hypothetical protein
MPILFERDAELVGCPPDHPTMTVGAAIECQIEPLRQSGGRRQLEAGAGAGDVLYGAVNGRRVARHDDLGAAHDARALQGSAFVKHGTSVDHDTAASKAGSLILDAGTMLVNLLLMAERQSPENVKGRQR